MTDSLAELIFVLCYDFGKSLKINVYKQNAIMVVENMLFKLT